jgi:hypothetical protein
MVVVAVRLVDACLASLRRKPRWVAPAVVHLVVASVWQGDAAEALDLLPT